MTQDIKWTKATRAKLHGFRTPHKHDPSDDAPWLTLCLERAGGPENGSTLEVNGAAAKTIGRLSEEMTADSPAPEELEFDATREYYRAALYFLDQDGSYIDRRFRWADVRALIRFWFEHFGLSGVFEVLTHSATLTRRLSGDPPSVSIEDLSASPNNPFVLSGRYDHNVYVWALSVLASELDGDELSAAVDEMRKIREGLRDDEWGLRFATAFAFRRETSFGDEDMEVFMKAFEPGGRYSGLELLVASLSSSERAQELLHFKPKTQPGRYAYDWVEAYGKDAAALLEHALKNRGPGFDGKTLKAALKLASK